MNSAFMPVHLLLR